jgi:MarR family transcriptional regulator for hemolysin
MKVLDQTDARWSALYMVEDVAGGVNQTDLADRLGVKGPTVVRLLDSLEADGLVKRVADPGDRRSNLIVIEEAGRAVIAEVDKHAAKMRDELFSGIGDNDLEAALQVLQQLTKRLDG